MTSTLHLALLALALASVAENCSWRGRVGGGGEPRARDDQGSGDSAGTPSDDALEKLLRAVESANRASAATEPLRELQRTPGRTLTIGDSSWASRVDGIWVLAEETRGGKVILRHRYREWLELGKPAFETQLDGVVGEPDGVFESSRRYYHRAEGIINEAQFDRNADGVFDEKEYDEVTQSGGPVRHRAKKDPVSGAWIESSAKPLPAQQRNDGEWPGICYLPSPWIDPHWTNGSLNAGGARQPLPILGRMDAGERVRTHRRGAPYFVDTSFFGAQVLVGPVSREATAQVCSEAFAGDIVEALAGLQSGATETCFGRLDPDLWRQIRDSLQRAGQFVISCNMGKQVPGGGQNSADGLTQMPMHFRWITEDRSELTYPSTGPERCRLGDVTASQKPGCDDSGAGHPIERDMFRENGFLIALNNSSESRWLEGDSERVKVVLLHELLHAAGLIHGDGCSSETAPRCMPREGSMETDRVNACSRACGGCVAGDLSVAYPFQTSNRAHVAFDASRCADSRRAIEFFAARSSFDPDKPSSEWLSEPQTECPDPGCIQIGPGPELMQLPPKTFRTGQLHRCDHVPFDFREDEFIELATIRDSSESCEEFRRRPTENPGSTDWCTEECPGSSQGLQTYLKNVATYPESGLALIPLYYQSECAHYETWLKFDECPNVLSDGPFVDALGCGTTRRLVSVVDSPVGE